jgi:hypothetical protein
LLSAWTTTDCGLPTITVTLLLPARSSPLNPGTVRVWVAGMPDPWISELDDPPLWTSSATPIAARMTTAVTAAIDGSGL